MRKGNIRVVFTPPTTIRKMIDSMKDLIKPRSYKGVYPIPCSCGKVYIGETGKSLLKEHNADLRHDRFEKSSLAKLSHKTKNQICIDKAMIIPKNII